jgi:hypothetical protein
MSDAAVTWDGWKETKDGMRTEQAVRRGCGVEWSGVEWSGEVR